MQTDTDTCTHRERDKRVHVLKLSCNLFVSGVTIVTSYNQKPVSYDPYHLWPLRSKHQYKEEKGKKSQIFLRGRGGCELGNVCLHFLLGHKARKTIHIKEKIFWLWLLITLISYCVIKDAKQSFLSIWRDPRYEMHTCLENEVTSLVLLRARWQCGCFQEEAWWGHSGCYRCCKHHCQSILGRFHRPPCPGFFICEGSHNTKSACCARVRTRVQLPRPHIKVGRVW